MGFIIELADSESQYSVTVEDDDKVAYAYLIHGDDIVSDVWLYNRGPAPEEPEWTDEGKMPFANPREYCEDDSPPQVQNPDAEVTCVWGRRNGEVTHAEVEIGGTTFARLSPGAKPGWSRLAKKDGPLAKVL